MMPKTNNAQNTVEDAPAKFRLAAIQMLSTPRVDENLATADRLLADAAAQGAQLALLPEYFAIMGLRECDKIALREADGQGPI